jgi:four helix bundle protein
MGKGRLKLEFLERTEAFADRCLQVAEQIQKDGRFSRIVDQLAGSGSSVGANLAEADEAMSLKDFRKCLAIAIKELAETRYWLRLLTRRAWLPASRLDPLMTELTEIKLIIGTILTKTRPLKETTDRSLAS